jgi:ribonuclease J
MLVRATDKFDDYLKFLESQINRKDSILIYSIREEYINPKSKHSLKRYMDFVGKYPVVNKIHTSVHASADCLVDVCNFVNPTIGIIPIHNEHSADLKKLPIKDELKSRIITTSKIFDVVTVEIPTK